MEQWTVMRVDGATLAQLAADGRASVAG
jgi:hypothetical protein